jgi:hypothetical protein
MGLKRLGINVLVNEIGDLTGCLHDNPQIMTHAPETLLGPNIFIRPADRPELVARYHNFLVPSAWVWDEYKKDLGPDKKIIVWPVGIDTDRFCVQKTHKHGCLLYFKNRSSEELATVQRMLGKFGQFYTLVIYGSYTEDNLLSCLGSCSYAVLLTHTESQGIGYMEILSTGTPCFVLNQDNWRGRPATSTPYFDGSCGFVSNLERDYEGDFRVFLGNLSSYSPRDYIFENHRLEISAEKYFEILKELK